MHRRNIVATLLVVGLALVTGCGGGGDVAPQSGGRDQVTVGVIPIVDVAPIYLGKEKGFFRERDIDLTLKPGSGGAVSVPGVVRGDFQFAFANITTLLVARDQNLPLKILTNGVASTGEQGRDFSAVVVRADSPIRTARDLAGRTVSVNNLRNIGDTTVRASVRAAGGDPATPKFVEMTLPEMPAAVQNKRVDAAWVVEPFLSQTISQGARPIAWNFVDAAPDLTVATYFTSEKVLRGDPDLADRFAEAMTESLAYAQEHPEEARKIVSTYTEIPPDVLAKVTLPAWPPEVNRASVETIAGLVEQDGLVKKAPDVDALLSEVR